MKISNVTRLPQYLHEMRSDIEKLYKIIEELNYKVVTEEKTSKDLDQKLNEANDKREELAKEIAKLRTRNAELEHMVTLTKRQAPKNSAPTKASSDVLFAENHDLDSFYLEFENHFRGDEAEIRNKQLPYIEVFNKSGIDKSLPIVDMGCGRGEFLELLAENKFHPVGVDLNEAMVKQAKNKGFEAFNNDAISYLLEQKSDSLGGITGFHLAEHIPFDQLLLLMSESYRCLKKGGVLVLETPNPESLFVGAYTFHYDPSHLKPLPPAIVQFSAKFKGFERADIMRMQPELTEEEIAKATKNSTLQNALHRLYGPRDYALVAYK